MCIISPGSRAHALSDENESCILSLPPATCGRCKWSVGKPSIRYKMRHHFQSEAMGMSYFIQRSLIEEPFAQSSILLCQYRQVNKCEPINNPKHTTLPGRLGLPTSRIAAARPKHKANSSTVEVGMEIECVLTPSNVSTKPCSTYISFLSVSVGERNVRSKFNSYKSLPNSATGN